MKLIKKTFLLSILLITTIYGKNISLINSSNFTLDISGRLTFLMNLDYYLLNNQGYFGFAMEDAKLALDGSLFNSIDFKLSLDFAAPAAYSRQRLSMILQKVYIEKKFNRQLVLRLGQFTVPFGYENNLNKEKRPNLYHYEVSRELTPDIDRGIMLSGKKILKVIGYNIGIFNGVSPEQTLQMNNLLASGTLFFRLKNNYGLNLKFGYSAAYTSYNLSQSANSHRFGHGLFSRLKIKGGKMSFYLLMEYLERREYISANEVIKIWDRGGGLTTAIRVKNIEPVITIEFFNDDQNIKKVDDALFYHLGLNNYFLEDKMRIRFNVKYRDSLYEKADELNLAFILQLII